MGNTPPSATHTHEPLDNGFVRGRFGDVKNGKTASFRFSKRSHKNMDRLRRSFRDSFRRRKPLVPESSKPHQWQADEDAVRTATCTFMVKYLGCVEVFESRGMQVCEEALKVLRNSRRRAVRGQLQVSGDGLRVVDDETKGLIVDQTIEKVSFCAPDRNFERGFSYICRDGTTRRWMCHGFLAVKDSGERLSHAVGCAFGVCLERKQRRDKECGVTMTFDSKNSTFTRLGSFRQQTLTEQQQQRGGGALDGTTTPSAAILPQPKPFNPFAIERPRATLTMLERQGSFRAFSTIGSQSPFKRQMSLRINDLPSNSERKNYLAANNGVACPTKSTLGVVGGPLNRTVSPIPEMPLSKSPGDLKQHLVTADTVNQLCQELSQGLSLLSQTDVCLPSATTTTITTTVQPTQPPIPLPRYTSGKEALQQFIGPIKRQEMAAPNKALIASTNYTAMTGHLSVSSPMVRVAPSSAIITSTNMGVAARAAGTNVNSPVNGRAESLFAGDLVNGGGGGGGEKMPKLPRGDQWLGQVVHNASPGVVKRQPSFSSIGRTQSLSSVPDTVDPFDAEWATNLTKPLSKESSRATVVPTTLEIPPFVQQPSTTSSTDTQPSKQFVVVAQPSHSTNPFITTPKSNVTTPNQLFQLQL